MNNDQNLFTKLRKIAVVFLFVLAMTFPVLYLFSGERVNLTCVDVQRCSQYDGETMVLEYDKCMRRSDDDSPASKRNCMYASQSKSCVKRATLHGFEGSGSDDTLHFGSCESVFP